ncbi:MAG TPA: hypothetical protein VGD98_16185 [Ktedonobacteraceae bacterium]
MIQRKSFLITITAGLCLLLLLTACGSSQSSGDSGKPNATPSVPTSNAQPTPTATTLNTQSTPAITPTQGSSGSLEQIDWSNFTYTFSCFTSSPVQVKMKNGQADANGVHYTVQKPVFGDLNGDGQSEVVILYHCAGGGTSPQLVYVYTGTEQHLTIMAYLPGANNNKLATVTQAAVVAGILQLTGYGYSDGVPLCCPDLLVTSTYKWNGSALVLVTTQSVPRPANS